MNTHARKARIGAVAAFCVTVFAAASLLIAGTPGSAGDTTADRVLGQSDFTHNAVSMINAQGLYASEAVAIDASAAPNRVYVADASNNRVLGWRNATSFVNGATADLVIGQPDFLSAFCNGASGTAVSANSQCYPAGVAVDGSGNLYVADTNNSRVLEYTDPFASCAGVFPCVGGPANLVFGQGGSFTTNLGNNGEVSADSLDFPSGVAVDASGNLYVADSYNHRVLEYNTPLTNSTADKVFGQGGSFTTGDCNSGGISADSLCYPSGVTVDGSGNLYVADPYNHRVLEYNTPLTTDVTADKVFGQGGSFTTGACNNGGTSANSLCYPMRVALDGLGNLYVADTDNHRVLEYNIPLIDVTADMVFGQDGSFTSSTQNKGGVTANSLYYPGGVAADGAGNLYVADGNNRVLEYDTPLTTDVTADRVLGQSDFTHGGANMMNAQGLYQPEAVVIDASAAPNRVYVADEWNHRVLGWRNAASFANGAAADLVIGQLDFRSVLCNGTGGSAVSANGLCYPRGVAVDGSGNLYVADTDNHRVLEYTDPFAGCVGVFPCVGGPANLVFGQGGSFTIGACNNGGVSADSLCYPLGVALDGSGNLYVADDSNNRVLEYDIPLTTDVTADRVFGQGGSFATNGCDRGGRSANSLCGPAGVAVDGSANLYVADGNSRVLEYNTPLTTDVTADRVFGQGGIFTTNGCNNGIGEVSANSLCDPFGVAVDGSGNLYVADGSNSRVLEYNTPLTNTTANEVFGQGQSFTSSACNSGGISADTLCEPAGVAVDGSGNLYVADYNNNRVLEYDQPLPVPTPVPVTLKIKPKALKFPKTAVGTPSKPKTVKVSNPKGNRKHPGLPVLIEMISAPGVFTETNNCPASLSAGTGCSISVTFTPSAAIKQTGTLTITDNANDSPQHVSLSGTGKAAK